MLVSEITRQAISRLTEVGIKTAWLDAEVLLAYVLGKSREWLVAHSDEVLSDEQITKFDNFVERRLNREPVAYIVGKKEFYGRNFIVTPNVLTPRPETEDLVELSLEIINGDEPRIASVIHLQPESALLRTQGRRGAKPWSRGGSEGCHAKHILDVGCGSGCVGITLKLERPNTEVTLSDISPGALKIAKQNAASLSADVDFFKSDLLDFTKIQNPKSKIYYDIIVANLPYVNPSWKTSPETKFEPTSALYASDSGLGLIKKLIKQSKNNLKPSGYLLLEADPEQHELIKNYSHEHGLSWTETKGYAISFVNR